MVIWLAGELKLLFQVIYSVLHFLLCIFSVQKLLFFFCKTGEVSWMMLKQDVARKGAYFCDMNFCYTNFKVNCENSG